MIASRVRAASAAVLLLVVTARVHATCPDFSSSTSYSAGTAPYGVALSDVDRDGNLDLITANSGSANLTLRLGITGGFSNSGSTTLSLGTAPVFVVAGDFNGDGKPDLAAANRDSANVSILIGNGDGTFASAVNYGAGNQPYGIAAADLNRDGRVDLAVANYQSGTVSILIGNGNGTFQGATSFNAGGAIALAGGDFNRDGSLDLAVARNGVSQVAIYTNNGSGTFTIGTSVTTQTAPRAVATIDLNRDGFLDLAIANEGGNSVSVALGAANATFGSATHYAAGTAPRSIVALDLTGEGKPDVAVANTDTDNLSVFLGNGDGTLQTKIDFAAGDGPRGLAAGVMGFTDRPSLVIANELSNNATLRSNFSTCSDNCGSFAAATTHAAGTTPGRSSSGDFNRDGKIDLAVPNAGSNTISILLGNGDGTFTTGTSLVATGQPSSTATGDFNRDGKLDIAVAYGGVVTISIFLGTGSGTFTTAASPPTIDSAAYDVAVGDFNNDGKLDIAAPEQDFGTMAVILGNGNGTFASASSVATGVSNPQVVEVADFNRDGKLDLATIDDDATVISVLLGDGTGSFAAPVTTSAGGTVNDILAGDFNHDGIPDVATSRKTTILATMIGTGSGTFGSPQTINLTGIPAALASFRNSSTAVIVAVMPGSNKIVRVLTNVNTGAPNNASYFDVGSSPSAAVSGDFNRDGRDDVAVSNGGSQNISLLANYCAVTFTLQSTANPSYYASSVTIRAYVNGSGFIAPTGTITFRDGGTVIGTDDASPSPAEYTNSSFTVGTHPITATYGGDGFHVSAVSSTLNQVVNVPPPTEVYAIPNDAATMVTIAWQPAAGGSNYKVYRSSNNGAFALIGQTGTYSLDDVNVSPNITYLYTVRTEMPAPQGGFVESADSTRAAATTIAFVDEPLVVGATLIKQVHLTQLRTAVNAFRAAGGLPAIDFTDPSPSIVRAVHLEELGTGLSFAWSAAGLSIGYGPPIPSPGEVVTAAVFSNLRRYVRAAPYGGAPP